MKTLPVTIVATDNGSAIGCFAIVLLVAIGFGTLHYVFWGEQEGNIKVDDCRATVAVKEDSLETWFKKFTCLYQKTALSENS
jgi:hypothetical protein